MRIAIASMCVALSACAADPYANSDRPPTPQEIAECEAQGGAIEHIRAIHTWACYTTETPVR